MIDKMQWALNTLDDEVYGSVYQDTPKAHLISSPISLRKPSAALDHGLAKGGAHQTWKKPL